jgi:hypothetical protein
MKIQKLPVTCRDCDLVQTIEIVVDCPVDVAVASMKVASCSKCGSRKLLILTKKRGYNAKHERR